MECFTFLMDMQRSRQFCLPSFVSCLFVTSLYRSCSISRSICLWISPYFIYSEVTLFLTVLVFLLLSLGIVGLDYTNTLDLSIVLHSSYGLFGTFVVFYASDTDFMGFTLYLCLLLTQAAPTGCGWDWMVLGPKLLDCVFYLLDLWLLCMEVFRALRTAFFQSWSRLLCLIFLGQKGIGSDKRRSFLYGVSFVAGGGWAGRLLFLCAEYLPELNGQSRMAATLDFERGVLTLIMLQCDISIKCSRTRYCLQFENKFEKLSQCCCLVEHYHQINWQSICTLKHIFFIQSKLISQPLFETPFVSMLTSHRISILIASILIRLALIHLLSQYENPNSLSLTDIDYRVYSDAAHYVFLGHSPYERHTYRYSPLLAYMLTLSRHAFHYGKYIFVLFDFFAMLVILKLSSKKPAYTDFKLAFYGLNPLFIYLTVRGSCQSISCLLMYLLVFCLQGHQLLLGGVMYGLWVHFRMYPVIFGVPLLLYSWRKGWKSFFAFWLGASLTFLGLLYYFYNKYGFTFLEETYLYHLTRVDHRHNLSAYFYSSYLSMLEKANPVQMFLKFLPQLYLFGMIISKYAKSLELTIFLMTNVFVIFNSVLTVQYYMWSFTSLVLIVDYSKFLQQKRWRGLMHLFCVWVLGVLVWVWCAERIQGRGENLFMMMWATCLARTVGESWVFIRLVKSIDLKSLKKDTRQLDITKKIL